MKLLHYLKNETLKGDLSACITACISSVEQGGTKIAKTYHLLYNDNLPYWN